MVISLKNEWSFFLFRLKAAFPKKLIGDNFILIYRSTNMSGTIKLPHTCPHCKTTTAKNATELEEKFGYRTLPAGAANQSWCRRCRSKS